MKQEEWSQMYLDKDKPYDMWDDSEKIGSYSGNPGDEETAGMDNEIYKRSGYYETPEYLEPIYVSGTNKRMTEGAHFPIVTLILIVANVIAGVLCLRAGTDHVLAGGINYEYITKNHEFGRFISYMFLHANFEHIANNMVCLWLFGHDVEKKLGSLRMTVIYFGSGVGAGIASTFLSHMINPSRVRFCVGASGAVFGIICAYLFVDKLKDGAAKRSDMLTAIVFMVIFALLSMRGNVDIYGHIFGAVIGGVLAFCLNVKKWENYREDSFKKLVGIILCVWFSIMGIGEANIGKEARKLPDDRIDFIKEQSIFVENDDITFGEGLGYYCTKPEWEAFTSTENEDIVQFEGMTYYKGKERKLMMQFILDMDEKEFKICYFAFDGEAQNGTTVNDYFTVLCNRYRSGP